RGNSNNWLSIKLSGVKSNRNGIGAMVRVESTGGRQWRAVHSGSSYCSQSDLALTFGMGSDSEAKSVEIEWPSGQKDRFGPVAANQFVLIEEGKGIRINIRQQ
ncbi:MAG: ASPIC/UnbV domain-containing protein, partial [Bryobacteraceae bacterium]|nr:ASPIC/UnbV domain-containing protein [Bryobacteraceae bacterium]